MIVCSAREIIEASKSVVKGEERLDLCNYCKTQCIDN